MASATPNLDTPLMRQYTALKTRYPHALLFFRLGDFYEMFGEDAQKAAPVLGLVLTHRQGLPMCGVPHHAASAHLGKLMKAGFKVAMAEQMEDPSQAKGLVRRQVTRVITPGTLIEDELLESGKSNYLAALVMDTVGWGLAWLEASTGEFWATQALNDPHRRQLEALLARLEPAEILASGETIALFRERFGALNWTPQASPALAPAPEHWTQPQLWANQPLALKAALKAERYVQDSEPHLKALLAPQWREPHGFLQLDESAIRTLELVASASGEKRHTLWGVLDRTKTPMGSRLLKNWILHPLLELREIEERQALVEELFEERALREALAARFAGGTDLERILHRLATPSAGPRDLAGLRETLRRLPALAELRQARPESPLGERLHRFEELSLALSSLLDLLETALVESPAARASDGGFVKDGHHPELDELRGLKANGKGALLELEAREKARTGIPNLKIGYNSVFGYYLEVTKSQQAKAPVEWTRKQTLANAERYITPELKALESKVLGAEERIARLEAQVFEGLKRAALEKHAPLRAAASALAELDVLRSLAEAAFEHDYVKPRLEPGAALEIVDGRHPMVERTLSAGTFVPNDLALDGEDPRVVILTGPNMSGKSTYLRQNALIVIMAQIGSFVPAKKARIGVVDRVLTRIGAQDALSRGESTFMVEMRETAFILSSATPRSLVILDEVGRGTSTYDGISIAWAVLEHLHGAYRKPVKEAGKAGLKGGPGPKVLFATHYFELTDLPEILPGLRNFNVEAREWTNAEGKTEVVFLHKIAEGPADRSYGIHVAELAGLPASCTARARQILADFEKTAPGHKAAEAPLLPMFNEHPVLDELKMLTPEKMTPLQALETLARWKNSL